jgi:hypothetical protein
LKQQNRQYNNSIQHSFFHFSPLQKLKVIAILSSQVSPDDQGTRIGAYPSSPLLLDLD